MEPILPRPDPADARAVWSLPPGERIRLDPHYFGLTILLLVPMTLTATLGSISFTSMDGTAIVSFWPAAAFQVVFSIWFGIYGAIAGIVGPMLGNSLVGDSPFLFIPANAIQSCLAGLWFRYRRLDPRLRSRWDWLGLILVGCVLSNALGGVTGVAESHLRSLAAGGSDHGLDFWARRLLTWFGGNTVPCLFLAPALLKAASPLVVRDSMFCQSFWGGTGVLRRRLPRFRFSDLSMVGKLMVLALVAGFLPLLIVATWSVWSTMEGADSLAVAMNRQAAREIRNEIERHELLLGRWAAELDRSGLKGQDRRKLLQEWRSVPNAFRQLEVVDLAQIEAEMPSQMLKVFREKSVAFYRIDKGGNRNEWELRGVFRLASAPDEVLTGLLVWRQGKPVAKPPWDVEAVLVVDQEGHELYRRAPTELDDWQPEKQGAEHGAYTVWRAGRTWHVAEAALERLGCRFITLTSAHTGQLVSLTNIPNPVAVLINLAIFGSLIAGSAIAGRISNRVLSIAELVREKGAEPGKLQLPVRGRDELGYLAQTLNQMSNELALSVRQLQETTAEKERLAAEMELARQVQRAILPAELLQIPGYELAAAGHPAREVGGDFFDYFVRTDGRAVLMIGDAAGKGLRAAMFMTETHALAHAAALHCPTPDDILSVVNSAMISARRPSEHFVTMLCVVLDPHQHRLLYAGAGHNPPILIHDDQARNLELGGPPLAIVPDIDYPLRQIEMAPGDTLVLYTDGVSEAINTDEDFFGVERLEAVAGRHGALSAGGLLDAVLRAIREFANKASQSDDIALLILRRRK